MRKKELIEQIDELTRKLKYYEPLLEQYKTYNDICIAIQVKQNEIQTLSKQIAELKNTIENLHQLEIDNIYDAKKLYESWLCYYDGLNYDEKIDGFKHILFCSNKEIKNDIMQDKMSNYHFQHYGVEYNDQDLPRYKKTILYNAITSLISLCIHLKCDTLVNEIKPNNINKIFDKLYKFKKFLENMFKVIDLKIDDDIFINETERLKAIESIAILKAEKQAERRRQAEILREQEALKRELDEREEILKKELDKADIIRYNSIRSELKEISKRRKLTRGGWVYVIDCNDMIPNCYKIGITRRLDWTKRIDELSDASHSFRFNVRGIVWSDDVFNLETDMHRYLSKYRFNQFNSHKEHFICTLDEIEAAFKHFGYDVKLDKDVINYDYIESINILKENGVNLLTNI